MESTYWKSQGNLSVRKYGNTEYVQLFEITYVFHWLMAKIGGYVISICHI